jgi:hypothetical protein
MFTLSRFRAPLAGLPLLAGALLLSPLPAFGQAPAADPPVLTTPLPKEIDLNLINLPTTLSLKRHRGYFRLTHRFARDLRRGSVSDLAQSLFSLDDGAVIGLEYRYAITRNVHAGITRSMLSKTIQTFAKWDAVRQGDSRPVSISVLGSYEGLNNLKDSHQPGVAVTVSRTFGDSLALYATPAFVKDTHVAELASGHDHSAVPGAIDEHANHHDTWFTGIGARIRFCQTGYLVGEYTPRVAGYDPDNGVWGFAIEKRTGGHTLQLNITNSFGTTLGQIARGGSPHDVYLGFNITRKF